MSIDDRISCFDCRSLRRPNCGPISAEPELPRRCEEFYPKPGAIDQRTGKQRFPTLVAERDEAEQEKTRVRRDTAARGLERAKAALGVEPQ